MSDPIVSLFPSPPPRRPRSLDGETMEGLQRDYNGNILATMANALVILAEDVRLSNLLAYDEFAERYLLLRAPPVAFEGHASAAGPYPRAWRPEDVSLLLAYMQRIWSHKFSMPTIEAAMPVEATRNRYHPVRDWLASLRWDGKPRIDAWLKRAFGCPDDLYHQMAGAKMLIASVARIRRPGCKFDHTPVFEGLQGIGKSSALRELYGEDWFSDAMPDDLAGKDAAMALHGVWCLEMAELQQIIRSEPAAVKAFLTRQVDRFRPPYGKTYIDRPRQTILVGTTNDDEWLTDSTGNRRFWPLACQWVELAWIKENRTQLWAEAARREGEGESRWLDLDEARSQAVEVQSSRMIGDAWEEKIEEIIGFKGRITVSEVLDRLNIPNAQQSKPFQMRVAGILRRMGWRKDRSNASRFWIRGEVDTETHENRGGHGDNPIE